jgi:type VI secretion system secreted protein VgrG
LLKSQSIGLAYMQNVGLVKMASAGILYNLNVGLFMKTYVGLSKDTTVGNKYSVTVGGKSSLTMTPDSITLQVGQSSMVLKADGSIFINGKTIDIVGSEHIGMESKRIDVN